MAHRHLRSTPTMPETREWPPALRRLAKTSLAIVYGGSSVAGWHVVFSPEHTADPWWSLTLALLSGVGGGLALGFMLREWWMFERPAAWMVALGLSIYAVVDAVRLAAGWVAPWFGWEVPDGPDLGGTALLWVSAAAVGLRIVHLWAFDLNLNRARERAQAAWMVSRRDRDTGP